MHFFVIALWGIIPLICLFLWGPNAKSFLIAGIAGILLLSFNMVRLETTAPDSDFDILFGIRMLIFNGASLLVYGILFFLAKLCLRFVRRKTPAAHSNGEDVDAR